MSDPVRLKRYPPVDLALVGEHGPFVGQSLHAACRLPSGRVLSVHSQERPRHGGGSAFRSATLALWRDGEVTQVLEGLGDVGYFESGEHNATLALVDVAELSDGGLVALVWGEREIDGAVRLVHDTVWWRPGTSQPERLGSVAWRDDGFELLLWDCPQVGGQGSGAERGPFEEQRVLHRLRLA